MQATPIRAGLRSPALRAAAPTAGNAGRWRLYSGAALPQYWCLDGRCQEVLVVADLSSLGTSKPEIACLYAHWDEAIIGRWSDVVVDSTGVTASLTLYDGDDDTNPFARKVAALMAQDHPWECSIGEDARQGADYERIPPGQSVTVNGQTLTASPDVPLLVARNLKIHEASIVPFGADGNTGRLAAALSTLPAPKEPRMPAPLKALLAAYAVEHHALIAGLVADDKTEAEIHAAVQAAILKAKDTEIARLTAAMQAQATELSTLKAGGAQPPPEGSGEASAAPSTRAEAHTALRAEGLKGRALVAECRKRWPTLA